MPPPPNPFQVSILATGDAFANRKAEVARIRDAWTTPGAKLVVYGDRRLGKTAALDVAADRARRAGTPVVLVSLATAVDLPDAVRRLMAAVHRTVGKSWTSAIQDLAAKLKVSVSVKPSPEGTALPGLSLSFDPAATAARPAFFIDALDAIEAEVARRKLRLGIGIDEFQRLVEWGGEDIEWALKAALEKHRHLSYVFAGSARTLIEEMVSNKRRALWKAVDTLAMGPIDAAELAAWIVKRSHDAGTALSEAVAASIVSLAGPRTRDIVLLAGETWDDAREHRGKGDSQRALDRYVKLTESLHQRAWDQLTDRECRILRALASDPMIELTSEAARNRHALGAASSVQTSLQQLLAEEVLTRVERRYAFDDPFFRRWVEMNTREDLGEAPE
jgi:hypothetical protein